jgi:hypothetical protein
MSEFLSFVSEYLAYIALVVAAAYAAFVLWKVLRGSFDHDDDAN